MHILVQSSLHVTRRLCHFSFFFFNDTATTEIYTLSLHDALPISSARQAGSAGPSATTWPNRQRESRAKSRKAVTSAASSGTSAPESGASTTVPVSANQRSAGERSSGRRGASKA